jgi:hypothetical protein
MPMIYKVRDPVTKRNEYFASYPQARKSRLDNEDAVLEVMEYNYKWQLVVMLNDAYKQGAEDVLNGMD